MNTRDHNMCFSCVEINHRNAFVHTVVFIKAFCLASRK